MNINFNVPLAMPLPLPKFKDLNTINSSEKLSNARGDASDGNGWKNTADKKIQNENNSKEEEQNYNSKERKRYPRWFKVLIFFIAIGIVLPILTWMFEQLARMVKAARSVEEAFA